MIRCSKSNEKSSKKHAANTHKFTPMSSLRAFDILIPHVVSTLPDSMMQREVVLNALASCAPPGYRSAPLIRMMQVYLQEHKRIQRLWKKRAEPGKKR